MQQREFIPKDSIERRVKARELAFQALFQYDIQACGDKGILDLFIRESCQDDLVRSLAREWTFGTIQQQEHIDSTLAAVLKRWKTAALMPVERAILRLSVYQLTECGHIPGKVVINEAIELAKKFSSENSPGFVNGILDAVLKKLSSGSSPEQTVNNDNRET
jgi:N utilization substance protein B